MKILSVSHLYVVGALLLGLFVAWCATMPQLTTGEQRGGCPCSEVTRPYCDDKDGGNCTTRHYSCNQSGNGKCRYLMGAGSQPCLGDPDCDNDINENCID